MEKRYCNTKKKLNQNKITEIVMKSATIEKCIFVYVVLVEAFNMFMISVSKQYLEGINSFCILLCMWSHILLLKTATILTLLHWYGFILVFILN
jgi:hypothetical protein